LKRARHGKVVTPESDIVAKHTEKTGRDMTTNPRLRPWAGSERFSSELRTPGSRGLRRREV